MAHGNRVYEPIKVAYIEWNEKLDKPNKIADWIKECTASERLIAEKNAIASKEFHKSLQR